MGSERQRDNQQGAQQSAAQASAPAGPTASRATTDARNQTLQNRTGAAEGGPASPGSDPARVAAQLHTQLQRLRNFEAGDREGHAALMRLRRGERNDNIVGEMTDRAVGRISETLSGAGRIPPMSIWNRVDGHLRAADDALAAYERTHDRSHLDRVRSEVEAATRAHRECSNQVSVYRERTEDGAEQSTETLRGVVATCAMVATIVGGVVAVPAGVAATSGVGIVTAAAGSAAGAGASCLVYGGAERASGVAQGESSFDLRGLLAEAGTAALTTLVSALVGGALSRVFFRFFAATLIPIANRMGATRVAERLSGGAGQFLADFFGNLGATPLSTALTRAIGRFRGQHPPTETFLQAVVHDMVQGGIMQALMTAATHVGPRGAAHAVDAPNAPVDAPAGPAPATPASGGVTVGRNRNVILGDHAPATPAPATASPASGGVTVGRNRNVILGDHAPASTTPAGGGATRVRQRVQVLGDEGAATHVDLGAEARAAEAHNGAATDLDLGAQARAAAHAAEAPAPNRPTVRSPDEIPMIRRPDAHAAEAPAPNRPTVRSPDEIPMIRRPDAHAAEAPAPNRPTVRSPDEIPMIRRPEAHAAEAPATAEPSPALTEALNGVQPAERQASWQRALRERYDALPPAQRSRLSFDQFRAIHAYTGSDLYRPVNAELRNGEPSEAMRAPVEHIDAGLQRLPALGTPTRCARSARLEPRHLERYQNAVGGEIVEGSYVSTTLGDVSAPVNQIPRPGDPPTVLTRFRITSRSGRNISGVSAKPGEGEVLIPRGTRFRVIRAEYVANNTSPDLPRNFEVELEEVPAHSVE